MWESKRTRHKKEEDDHYSISNKLRLQGKIDEKFEVMLSSLTLEEIIGLKLELASSYINNRLYGIPIWTSTYYICREACLRYALSACRTMKDAASLMGINESDFRKEIKRFNIKLD